LYDDAKRLATYTTKAHIVSSERDVTGDKIELFLEAEKNELQRAEAYGQVQVKEPGRTATGARLTYTAATEEYFMTGTPVVVIQKQPDDCKQTTASSVKFRKAIDTVDAGGVGPIPLSSTKCAPGTR
jgi:lipopolysaccharide export system protein LptA